MKTYNFTECRSSENKAIGAASFGAISSSMISESAIIILFASMLGASDMVSLVTTSLGQVALCLFLLPFSAFSNKLGYKRMIIYSSIACFFLMTIVAASPWFGDRISKIIFLSALGLFSIFLTMYVAAWFPLLSTFLNPNTRSHFFGRMRFSWQLVALAYFFISGLIIGKTPPVWLLQLVVLVSAFGMLIRAWYIHKIPVIHTENTEKTLSFREGIKDALSNKPLCGFSVYICCLYLAAFATLPLTYVYLRYLHVADNIVVIISSIALAGSIIGYLLAGRLVDLLGVKKLMLFVHFFFAGINIILFFISNAGGMNLILVGTLLAIYGFCLACSSVAISSEMMAMVSETNKTISMAFCGTFYAIGRGGSRLLTSLVLGSGMLATKWNIASMEINHYQTLFLFLGCAIAFVCLMLVLVPAIFPKSNYSYLPH